MKSRLFRLAAVMVFFSILQGCAALESTGKFKPTYGGANRFPDNGKAIVWLKFIQKGAPTATNIFASFGPQDTHRNVMTMWRRLNDDKTEGELINLTGGGDFLTRFTKANEKESTTAAMLEPGTYIMADVYYNENSVDYFYKNNSTWWDRKGWDPVKNQPRLASFEAKASEEIVLPTIEVDIDKTDKKNMRLVFIVDEDPKHRWTFGDLIEVRTK